MNNITIIRFIILLCIFYVFIKILQINGCDINDQYLETLNKNRNNNKKNADIDIISNELVIDIPDVLEHGFHDEFAKKNGYINNKLLGWRYWYLKNKSKYMVKDTNNFEGIVVRRYLNTLPNLENWFYNLYNYKNIDNQIIE